MARFLVLLALSLAACADDGPSSADKKAACGNARDCTPDDDGCTAFPYEQLPQRCFDICYWHECCRLGENEWQRDIYDCVRPADAGVAGP